MGIIFESGFKKNRTQERYLCINTGGGIRTFRFLDDGRIELECGECESDSEAPIRGLASREWEKAEDNQGWKAALYRQEATRNSETRPSGNPPDTGISGMLEAKEHIYRCLAESCTTTSTYFTLRYLWNRAFGITLSDSYRDINYPYGYRPLGLKTPQPTKHSGAD